MGLQFNITNEDIIKYNLCPRLFHHGTTIKYEYLHTKHIAWVHTAYNSSKTKSILITI